VTSGLEPICVLRPDRKASCFQQPHNKQTSESAGLQFILDTRSVSVTCYSHWNGKWTVCITRRDNVQMGSRTKLRGNEHVIENRQLMQSKCLRNKDQTDALFCLNLFQ
jgi:GH24 family phage-related lysozyme (muramidase)